MAEEFGRSLFIDCGGYDGCSALAFLLENPHFDCVSFEPNPELWKHYDQIPTKLIKKAVYTYDGTVSLTLDTIDADGSTIIEGKRVDFKRRREDSSFPKLDVPCIDLSAYVRKMSKKYPHIVLKLDIEGAEYDILEKMLADGTLDLVERLYCEFHASKMGIAPERHDDVVSRVEALCKIHSWDALPFAVFCAKDVKNAAKCRTACIRSIRGNRERLQAAARLSRIVTRARQFPLSLVREKISYTLRLWLARLPLLSDYWTGRFAMSARRRAPNRDSLKLSKDSVLEHWEESSKAQDQAAQSASHNAAAKKALKSIQKGYEANGGPAVTSKRLRSIIDAVMILEEAESPEAQGLRDQLAKALFPVAPQCDVQADTRVAYIHSARMPTSAANNVSAMKMCAALRRCGMEVTLYAEQEPNSGQYEVEHFFDQFAIGEQFPIRLMPGIQNRSTRTYYDLVAVAIADGCTHIYTRSLDAALFAAIADVPVFLEEHKAKNSDKIPYLAFLAKSSAFERLILISRSLQDHYTKLLPALERKTLVLHDGADLDVEPAASFDLHADFESKINVGYVGHLYPGKGAELCMEVANRMPHVAFHMLGGTEKDIARWKAECGNSANIHFYGHHPHRTVSAFIQSVDICIAPFLREVNEGGGKHNIADVFSPLKIFEYMAHGKPIVVSDLPVLREILEDEKTALFCNPDAPETFQAAIERLMDDSVLREVLGRNAREELRNSYTWKRRAEHVQAMIDLPPIAEVPAMPAVHAPVAGETASKPVVHWFIGEEKATSWAYGINAGRLSSRIERFGHITQAANASPNRPVDIALAFDILIMSSEEFAKCEARRKILRVGGPKPLRIYAGDDRGKLAQVLSQVDAVIALSPQLRDDLADLHPSVHFIPNGLDLEQFHPDKRQREPGAPFTVGMAASLRMEEQRQIKGYYIAKKASSLAGVKFIAVGRGKKHVPHDRMIEEFYSKIDVLVHPANVGKEGSSNVIMEALSLGVPVVTTRYAGFHGQTLCHGEEALIPRRTAAEFTAAIIALMNDSVLRERLSQAGRQFAERHHCIESIARRYEKVFHSCLSRPCLAVSAGRSPGEKRKAHSVLAAKPDANAHARFAVSSNDKAHAELAVKSDNKGKHPRKSIDKLVFSAAKGQASQSEIEKIWTSQRGEASSTDKFRSDIAHLASQFGYFEWPKKVFAAGRRLQRVACGPESASCETDLIAERRVLDVGCGSGLHGLGFITLGVRSYLGLDPSLSLDSDVVKNKLDAKLEGGFTPKKPFGWTPSEINALFPQITLLKGTFEELNEKDRLEGFDIITMHTVTEHLMNIKSVFAGCADLLAPGGVLVFLHHNFYGWNGHHMAPKNVAAIDPTDAEQQKYIDWNHLSFEPPEGHYFHRGLNRIRLDELRALTEDFFDIVEWKETENDYGRLTDEILARHPEYSRRELATSKVFCIAKVHGLD